MDDGAKGAEDAGELPRAARGYHAEVDRRAAIGLAARAAQAGDVLLIAGKGHESGQIIGDRVLPFSDQQAVAEILKEMR